MTDAVIQRNQADFGFWFLAIMAGLLSLINIMFGIYFAYDAIPDGYRELVHYGLSPKRSTFNLALLSIVAFVISISILNGSWTGRHRRLIWFVFLSLFPALIFAFALIYEDVGLIVDGKFNEAPDKGVALYFSIVTWTTLGYGDVTPKDFGRVVASVEVLTGYILSAMLIALIVAEFQRGIRANAGP